MFEFPVVQTGQNPEHHKYPGNETKPVHPVGIVTLVLYHSISNKASTV